MPTDREPDCREDDGAALYAHWISLAGRLRMLSQRIGLQLLLFGGLDDRAAMRERLLTAVGQFEAGQRDLLAGDPAMGVPPLPAGAARSLFEGGTASVGEKVTTFLEEVRAVAEAPADGTPVALSVTRLVQRRCDAVLAALGEVVGALEAERAAILAARPRAGGGRQPSEPNASPAATGEAAAGLSVAFNAKVAAARIGPLGTALAALTEELKMMSEALHGRAPEPAASVPTEVAPRPADPAEKAERARPNRKRARSA